MKKLRNISIILLLACFMCGGSTFGQSKKHATLEAPPSQIKVYRALLFQTLDMPSLTPDVIVLENSLGGNVVWTRTGTGSFRGTLTNAFPLNKTFVRMPTAISSHLDMIENYILNANDLIVTTRYGGSYSDYMLNTTPVEILVYP